MPPDFVKGATGGTKAKTAKPIQPITGEYFREQLEGMGALVQGEVARCYTSFIKTFQSTESKWQEKFNAVNETTAKLSDKTDQHSEAINKLSKQVAMMNATMTSLVGMLQKDPETGPPPCKTGKPRCT